MFIDSGRNIRVAALVVLIAVLAAACNLTSAPQEQLELTDVPTSTMLPTRTLVDSAPTPVTVTSLPIPTQVAQRPTAIAILPPTTIFFPTPSPQPVNIVILSPIPGNVVAGNVQIIGAASHPNFLQYQLEWGPDPNPGDLWFLASGVVQNPVINGLLGIWNTTGVQDGQYQLRLKVFLRDGTSLATVVNSIRVQNNVPTSVPTVTTIPRPIAAFSQDRVSGQAPLVVRFFNQSSGNITSYSWDFGDGGSSSEHSPTHTFRNPGVFTVTLTVRGPGGSSNVSRQITVQSTTPPVAGFTQDKTSGPAPLTVQFTDQSQGDITQRIWNFGDGTTSTEVNPSHTFQDVGTYNVILTVSGPGGSSSVTRQITVQNPTIPEPIAALVASATEGEAPLTVQFDATDSSGQIDSYNWDFGDGSLGSGQIVTHTFEKAGVYEVKLLVVGPGGQSEARIQINVVQPPDAPIAVISTDRTSGEVPLTINFDASGSTGPIDSYSWDFGDGQTGSGVSVQHTFTAAGTYTVQLLVEGPGGSDTETVEISAVEPIQPPEAAFEFSPASGPAPLDVQFINLSQGEELTFTWDFGDGSPTSNERDPQHRYEDAGEYEVILSVSGPGGTDEARATVIVTQPDEPPVAVFNAQPTSGPAPLEVQFINQTIGENLSFEWDFGDGSPVSDARDPLHLFEQPGEYTVTLTVTGPGGSSTAEMVINVGAPIPPADASFNANPSSGEAPLIVNFVSTGDPNNIAAYFWEFGDGGVSVDPNPQHIYTEPGTYTVRLTVTGIDGREVSAETTISVSEAVVIAPPQPGFTVEPASGTVGQSVQFTNTTSGDVSGYEWDFGDGTTSTEANPTHVYNEAREYIVSLRAFGPGGENTIQQPYSVVEPAQPPQPGFTVEPASGTVGQSVQFTNTTSGDVSGYEWDFGDGTTSTEANPTHVYNEAREYIVSLRAFGPGGENTIQQPYSVVEPAQPPQPGFTVEPASATVGQSVQFTNTTSGDVSGYEWDFGDGTTSTEANPTHVYNEAREYIVSLRAFGPGGENTIQQPYTVVEPAQPEPSIVEQTPILPEIASQEVRNRLRAVFDHGAAQGKRAAVFAVIGDDMALQSGYLDPFADPGLDTNAPELQNIINWYNQIDLGDGRSSFDRSSAATGAGWRIQDLLDPNRSGGNCNPGETPLECELRLIQPSVALISIGLNDVGTTDPDVFRAAMEQTLLTVLSNGVIPVVSTVQPNPANADQVRAINEAIIEAVQNIESTYNTEVPLYNLWRAYDQLPNSGLEGDNRTPTTAPPGPGRLGSDAISNYGINARNHGILTILDLLRSQVFPDASA